MSALLGVQNANSKKVGRKKFWLDLGISGAFLIGLESLILDDFCVSYMQLQIFLPSGLGVSDLSFFFPFDFQEQNLSEFVGTVYRTEYLKQIRTVKHDRAVHRVLVGFCYMQLPLAFLVILFSFICTIISKYSVFKVLVSNFEIGVSQLCKVLNFQFYTPDLLFSSGLAVR